MNSEEPAIMVEGLVKRFGSFTAVNNISYQVNRGEIFGFLGPNGSGKTTTIRMSLGLLQPSAGSVRVLDVDVRQNAKAIRPRVGYMSQRFSLYNDLTVSQNLQFYGTAYGLRGELLTERIQSALEMSGLVGRESTLTRELSGGWRQRLALSAAILHQPQIIFLDEPTAGVDPVSRRAFWDLLYELIAQNITVFVTTHYMDEAEHCHRLAFIQHGELIAYGSPAHIKQEMMAGEVLEIATPRPLATVNVLRQSRDDGRFPLQEVELYGSLVHAVMADAAAHQRAVAAYLGEMDLEPEAITIIEPSLEDVFIACMR